MRVVFGGSDELADHLLAGSPADLFLTASPEQLDRLAEWRLLLPRTARAPLAENTLAAIGQSGDETPVRKPADLGRAEVDRIALAAPDCPLGRYTREYLESIGLYERLLPRVVWVDNSRAVVAAVRAQRAHVGLVYGSDAARADACRLLFRIPMGPAAIRYEGAILARGKQATETASPSNFPHIDCRRPTISTLRVHANFQAWTLRAGSVSDGLSRPSLTLPARSAKPCCFRLENAPVRTPPLAVVP